jgi:putative tryptophan/tyrosine transport system substrate-binding protein
MMERRTFITLLGGAAASWPIKALGQQQSKLPRVGYIFSFIPEEGQHLWEACRQGLRELGWLEGQNIALEPRWAHGRHERLPGLAAELVSLNVDVLVTAATPASLAAKAASTGTPIVFVAVADPVHVGLVASLARPGGNTTGLALLTPELSGRRLQLIREVVGQTPRVAVLMNPENKSHAIFLEETATAGRQMSIELQPLNARNPHEIAEAFEQASKLAVNALIVFDDPVIWSHRAQIISLAAKGRLPVMYGYSEFVPEGGLLSYGPYRLDLYRRTAAYVDRILKGAKPSDLPVERPTRFELFVNMKVARALGVAIPPTVLVQADRVIE